MRETNDKQEALFPVDDNEAILQKLKVKKLINAEIIEELQNSFITYSMSVIASRALPDVRDGLKPVQRRILYALQDLNITPNSRYKKSARIVGEVVGKYHPHGDSSIYGAIVLMAQPFSYRYQLIDGQGNFGSIDKDAPAAMRYTEVRMSLASSYLLKDIDKETVDFVDNYDGSEREPKVLPAMLPALLMNGSSGIAVGIATNIPPHNFLELRDGIIALINNPALTVADLMEYIPGPDFPTAGKIINQNEILKIYEEGRGSVIMQGVYHIEKTQRHQSIVITEIPFKVSKADLIKKIVELINQKKINGISDIKDESNLKGIRVVISVKSKFEAEIVASQIIKHTRFRTSFPVNMMGLIDQKPRLFNLKSLLQAYIDHQNVIVRRALNFDLRNAQAKAHIMEGFAVVLQDIDALIELIKSSKDRSEAEAKIIARFNLTEAQSNAILNLTLSRLTNLERQKIFDTLQELKELIKHIQLILSDQKKINKIIIDNLKKVNKKLLTPRLTQLEDRKLGFNEMELIQNLPQVIIITKNNYIKRVLYENFNVQKRAGVGSRSLKLYDDDDILNISVADSHDIIYFVTDQGRFFSLRVYDIPRQTKSAKGLPIVNLIDRMTLTKEKIKAVFVIKKDTDLTDKFLFLVTKNGRLKKTPAFALLRPDLRKSRNTQGKRCIGLHDKDQVITAFLSGEGKLVVASHQGKAIVTPTSAIRAQLGNNATGVRSLRLESNDYAVSACVAHENELLLSIYTKGYGKLVNINKYRVTSRIAKGVKTLGKVSKSGNMIGLFKVTVSDDLFIINSSGVGIIVKANDIRMMLSRVGKGVKIIKLKEDEIVKSVAVIRK